MSPKDSGRTKLSVVPPEFTPLGVHSYPVTGMTGGAFPPRGSEAPSPKTARGLAPSVPSLQLRSKVTVPLQSLISGTTLSFFSRPVKAQLSPNFRVYPQLPIKPWKSGRSGQITALTAPCTPKAPAFGGGFWCVLCVF